MNGNMRREGILQWQTLKLLEFLRTLRLTQPSAKNTGTKLNPNVFTTKAVAFGDYIVNDIWRKNPSEICGNQMKKNSKKDGATLNEGSKKMTTKKSKAPVVKKETVVKPKKTVKKTIKTKGELNA